MTAAPGPPHSRCSKVHRFHSGCPLKAVIRVLAVAATIVCALTSASLAGPQSYCDPFARDAANRKVGQTESVTGTIGSPVADAGPAAISGPANADGEWQKAYEASFTTCMSSFAPHEATASADRPAKSKPAVTARRVARAKRAATTKRTVTAKRGAFPDGAEVSMSQPVDVAPAKKAQKVASKAKSVHRHSTQPAATQDPSIESTADIAPTATDISPARHRQAQTQDAQPAASQPCTNVVCWLKQRRAKP